MQKILVVEDDFDIQELLQNFLQEAGYEVTTANDGVEAIAIFSDKQFDLILLDIMLPKIDGFSVCELIRKQSQIPIIMLTALSGEEEQIKGLDLQVDDYITKPFSMPVLVRKIAAVLRRSNVQQSDKHCIITYRNLILDLDSYTATVDSNTYELTQREYEVLRELLTHQIAVHIFQKKPSQKYLTPFIVSINPVIVKQEVVDWGYISCRKFYSNMVVIALYATQKQAFNFLLNFNKIQ